MSDEDCERVHLGIATETLIRANGEVESLLTDDEIENLCIYRGTLNDAERTIIQDHVVATIDMLENLPYPKHLRRGRSLLVEHHERVDGKGYPRQLTAAQMSPQARMMAIADVFEALTAADRPYKKPMPLSRALAILGSMKESGHIDADLFDIFVREKVWKSYGERTCGPRRWTR